MKQFYREFLAAENAEEMRSEVIELQQIENGQTFAAYRKAAEHTLQLLKSKGIPNAEIIEFPADGKTAYQDKRMPIAWDATVGRLTLLSGAKLWQPSSRSDEKRSNILADFQENPFHLVKGSTATPPGGIVTRIITEQQFLAGEDPRGALLMLEPFTWPRKNVITPMLDEGALGFVTDFVTGRYKSPETLQWLNAGTDSGDWHVTAEDRPFIGFCVTPQIGDSIRSMANSGTCKVRVECDGRRYSGTLPMVTALVPGKSKKEFWILAHLYEPLLNDDASGVIAGIEIARQFMQRGQSEYSLRLVFAMELYGFAAYAAYRGGCLKEQVVGACNIDTIAPPAEFDRVRLVPAGLGMPFIGNDILRDAYGEFKEELPRLELQKPAYYDDMFMSDASVGLPTTWILADAAGCWHNILQCSPDFIAWDEFCQYTAFAAAYIYKVINYNGPAARLPQLDVKEKSTPWRDYAARMTIARTSPGFPHSLANVPPEERITLPDGVIYGHFAAILSNLDAKKTLARAIAESEAELESELSESKVKKIVSAVNFLCDYGYLKAVERPVITESDIAAAMQKVGITKDDVLMVHASISNCGYIAGGGETIIKAIAANSNTSIYTTFTRPFTYLGGLNRWYAYRSFSPDDIESIWTGKIGKDLMRKFPNAVRSKNITHSWGGVGEKAHEILDAHGAYDSPCGENSPVEKVLQLGGKILYFGCGIAPTTMLHYIETMSHAAFLDDAVCRVRTPDGGLKNVIVPDHLPGHRDFYIEDAENCKFFKRAFARGLERKSAPLGMAQLEVIDCRQLYEIGMQLQKEDPRVLLCDNPDCLFCRRF
ncbi:MAG: DUF4910 domain-containing protein [Victivallales bacterium]|nr:DUF4910 domain-containing protein [Victivallales bacterium]